MEERSEPPINRKSMPNDSLHITGIVPVYNAGNDLTLCLNSLIAAGQNPGDIILVDDASTDEAAVRCAAEFGTRLHRFEQGPNGPALALICVLGFGWLQYPLLSFFKRRHGWGFLFAASFMHATYYVYASVVFVGVKLQVMTERIIQRPA